MECADGVLPPGARLGGRYAVEHVLGGGAMGRVYAARDDSGERLAVKTLLVPEGAGDGDERRARFLREAELCAELRHPNVVPVIDHGIDAAAAIPYLVMPLLVGEDLASLLDRVGVLEPAVAVALVVQASEGLAAAHARGIVHRDVKPSNLFLEACGDHVVVRVTDFGLAKAHDTVGGGGPDSGRGQSGASQRRATLTATGRFMGTPQYVAPEQAVSAKHVDERSDVFSLAMSLYHALSGGPAFAYVRSFMALVLEITARDAPNIQDAAPWVPPRVARVVHAALIRDRNARCPSARELGLGLDTAVGIDVSRRPLSLEALRPPGNPSWKSLAPRAELASSWDEVLRG